MHSRPHSAGAQLSKDSEGVTGRSMCSGRAIQTEGTECEGVKVYMVCEELGRPGESVRVKESREK